MLPGKIEIPDRERNHEYGRRKQLRLCRGWQFGFLIRHHWGISPQTTPVCSYRGYAHRLRGCRYVGYRRAQRPGGCRHTRNPQCKVRSEIGAETFGHSIGGFAGHATDCPPDHSWLCGMSERETSALILIVARIAIPYCRIMVRAGATATLFATVEQTPHPALRATFSP